VMARRSSAGNPSPPNRWRSCNDVAAPAESRPPGWPAARLRRRPATCR
jgi:hypothetical protein